MAASNATKARLDPAGARVWTVFQQEFAWHRIALHCLKRHTHPSRDIRMHRAVLHYGNFVVSPYPTWQYINGQHCTSQCIALHFLVLTPFHYSISSDSPLQYTMLHCCVLHWITSQQRARRHISIQRNASTATPHTIQHRAEQTRKHIPIHRTTSHHDTTEHNTSHWTVLQCRTLHRGTLRNTMRCTIRYYTHEAHYNRLRSTALFLTTWQSVTTHDNVHTTYFRPARPYDSTLHRVMLDHTGSHCIM